MIGLAEAGSSLALPKVTLQQVEDAKKGGVEHTVVTSATHTDNV
jgi:hypothetical protein